MAGSGFGLYDQAGQAVSVSVGLPSLMPVNCPGRDQGRSYAVRAGLCGWASVRFSGFIRAA